MKELVRAWNTEIFWVFSCCSESLEKVTLSSKDDRKVIDHLGHSLGPSLPSFAIDDDAYFFEALWPTQSFHISKIPP